MDARRIPRARRALLAPAIAWALVSCSPPHAAAPRAAPASAPSAAARSRGVIVFVWDGLRPDSVDAQHTPRLARLRDAEGTRFASHHSAYPTSTMINAAALATGAYPGTHAFYGNTIYAPGPTADSAAGAPVDFTEPVFTEDHAVLRGLDAYAVAQGRPGVLVVPTLFEAAHASGLRTAAVGKAGPAFLQDYREDGVHGVVLDENIAFPRAFAESLRQSGFPLPRNTALYPYPEGKLEIAGGGDPTATTAAASVVLADGVTSDPRSTRGSPHDAKNEYLMRVFTDYVLPKVKPVLSVVWLRNPDSTEHTFGPGSAPAVDALANQDALLGRLLDALSGLGLAATTDLIVVSDHGHSTVGGDPRLFPPRLLRGAADGSGEVGDVSPDGYSVSGEVRTADVLSRAGVPHVYDGVGCIYDPVLGGILESGAPLRPTQHDPDGEACGRSGEKYSTPSRRLPARLEADAVVIARNGGSDYVYSPAHDGDELRKIVTVLQQHEQYGAIFVRSAYGAMPGTLPMQRVHLDGAYGLGEPDLVVSFDWTSGVASHGAPPGTEYASGTNFRGMHGSTSPYDFAATLIAAGPSFKRGFVDAYPSANVDVAPTIANLLGFSLPSADGRVLDEAFAGSTVRHTVVSKTERAGPVRLARVCAADDVGCVKPKAPATYTVEVATQTLTASDGRERVYVDSGKVTRR
ncbi:MAG TPA: alkaline phosphatase family protein [Polyangiaceae bacterium]|nr:alkaline phosphatase family protein [Polyangiaceae bacterium]